MTNKVMGKGGLLLAVMIMAAMSFLSFFIIKGDYLSGELGLCLPSPNLWDIMPLWSWIADNFLILLIAVGLIFINKQYNFVKSQDYVLPGFFLVTTASVPWLTAHLTSSVILATVNFICIWISFGNYRQSNATQNVFAVMTMLSLGSMVQYAFILMVPAFIAIWLILKCFRFREFMAMILGLIAPYWVGIGLGLLPLESFHLPSLSNLFSSYAPSTKIFVLLINCGFTALLFLFISLNNAVKLYAGNSKTQALNNAFNTLGVVCALCMMFDFSNLLTYLTTFYLTASVQVGNMFALRQIRKGWVALLILALIYIASFAAIGFAPAELNIF